jgi:uncharacterized membrane protein YphA (DoxX/SURF4 family)
MSGKTRFFLVLLRLAIGWHFLFEGAHKIHSVWVGPTETNRPWTSVGYLREASGPAGDLFRKLAGDPDAEALELFAVQPIPEGQDPAKVTPHQRIPPLLDKAWNEYFQRFTDHYQLSNEPRMQRVFGAALAFAPQAPVPAHVPWAALYLSSEQDPVQYKMAQAKLLQAKDQAVRWLLGETGTREAERSFGGVTVKVKENPHERLQEYRDKVQQVRRIMTEELPAFGRDVEKRKLPALKADVNRLRTELLADLERPMLETLQSVLTEEQKKLGPVKVPAHAKVQDWRLIDWVDATTRYGLAAIGLCLLLGLFTRTACVGGAALLLLFYLAAPALPWLPDPPRAEGYYVFVNKNIIEMLALLTLATTRSGWWAGLDGLLSFVTKRGRRARSAADRVDAELVSSPRS